MFALIEAYLRNKIRSVFPGADYNAYHAASLQVQTC
jgi:hypothetical protein